MPTGYTAMIDDDPSLSTSKWVTQGLVRNFGVCVMLRDHDWNLTEKQIEEYLEKEVTHSTDYYREKLIEVQKILDEISTDSEKAWNELYDSTVNRMEKYNIKSIEEASIIKSRHQQVKEDLIKLRDNTKDEITRNIAKFGLSQLELAKSDTEPYISEVPSLEKFKVDKTASLNRDIEYYTKKMEEAKQRAQERLVAYQRIKSEVGKILGNQSLSTMARETK